MQDFHNKGFFIGGGGDMGCRRDSMRKNFDPCATWGTAAASADAANGEIRPHLQAAGHPHALPGHSHRPPRNDAGHAETAIVAKKDLMLEVKARAANQTDTLNPQVLVQNASRYAGTWERESNAHAADGTPVCKALANTTETSPAPGASATVTFPLPA